MGKTWRMTDEDKTNSQTYVNYFRTGIHDFRLFGFRQ